jgi:hypothetical protein
MQKIIAILFKYLRGEAHFQFLTLFRDLLHEFPAVQSLVAGLFATFITLLEQERMLIDAQKISNYTQKIADADHRNDRLLVGMKEVVNSAMRHFNVAVEDAAHRINNRLKAFGRISAKSYEEEAAAIRILVDDLMGELAQDAALVGINEWVAELNLSVTEFDHLLRLRTEEQAAKPSQRLRDVRREIDIVYHQMTAHINAAAVLDPAGAYDGFIARLNAQIIYFNDHNHHPAPKDIRKADVEPIAPQPYEEGKPATVLPKVWYVEKPDTPPVALVFAKDFTVTYRNNDRPGVADLFIHGKGAYKGKKDVTFNIVPNID